jgi:hypothetical protein
MSNKKQKDTVSVSGILLWSPTAAAASGENIFQARLNPRVLPAETSMEGGNKLASLGLLYQLYRFTKLSHRLICANDTSNPAALARTQAVSAYFAESPIVPTTFDEVLDGLSPTEVGDSTAVVNVNVVHTPSVPKMKSVPRSTLLDQQVKWWKTGLSSAVDDALELQGSLVLASRTSVASFTVRPYLEIHYTCEFSKFTGAAVAP